MDRIYEPTDLERVLLTENASTRKKAVRSRYRWNTPFLVMFFTALIAFVIIFTSISNKLNSQQIAQSELKKQVEHQQQMIASQESSISKHEAAISEVQKRLTDIGKTAETLQAQVAANGSKADGSSGDNGVGLVLDGKRLSFKEYVIKDGDTLYSICVKNGVDPEKYVRIIAEINGIDNKDLIHEGQILVLPFFDE